MGKDASLARAVLEDTQRTSWQLIWREEMEPRLTSASKISLQSPNREKSPSKPESAPEAPTETTAPAASTKPVSKRSPFHGWPRADKVVAVYLAAEARRDLGKIIKVRGGKEIWSLILAAIDAGF